MNMSRGLIVAAILLPIIAHAQFSLFSNRTLTLILSPENPAPGETVRLSVQSYAMDLDRSTITWSANGVVFAEGGGLKDAQITAGEAGSETRIRVEASSDESSGSAEAVIRPSEISLLWSTNSYTPPFFKGRKLPGTNAAIEAYALVRFTDSGAVVPDADIIYTWYRNDSVIASASGRGKSRAVFEGPARGTETIGVEAETVDRTHHARAEAPVTARDSRLVLYENHPLFGILFHRAIVGDVNTIERELKVTAIPYFARAKDPSTLSYEWIVNSMPIPPDPTHPETLTITAQEYNGPADIELVAMNPADFLMRSTGAWRLIFGGSGGIFFDNKLFGE